MNDQLEQQKNEQAQLSRARKQQKAGVQGILKENWADLMMLLTPTVREAVQDMVQKGKRTFHRIFLFIFNNIQQSSIVIVNSYSRLVLLTVLLKFLF